MLNGEDESNVLVLPDRCFCCAEIDGWGEQSLRMLQAGRTTHRADAHALLRKTRTQYVCCPCLASATPCLSQRGRAETHPLFVLLRGLARQARAPEAAESAAANGVSCWHSVFRSAASGRAWARPTAEQELQGGRADQLPRADRDGRVACETIDCERTCVCGCPERRRKCVIIGSGAVPDSLLSLRSPGSLFCYRCSTSW